jgi:hypothetical protein
MLIRPTTLVCATVALVALGAAPAAARGSVTTGAQPPSGQTYRAHWALDEVGGNTAVDSSGNHHDGTNHNVVGDGSGYSFNGSNSRVVVENAADLNSGSGDFSWGVTLSMTQLPMPKGETYDVLRKGLAGAKGGDYKVEIMNSGGKARARCVFNSVLPNGKRANSALMDTSTSLADGQQHTITCAKTSTGLTVQVDSHTHTKTTKGGLGTVSNNADLALGAKAEKTAKSGFDWFRGELFDAWVAGQ